MLTLLCAVFSTAWGQSDYSSTYTSNVTLSTSGGTSASSCKVSINSTEYDGIKCGTSSKPGAWKVTVPKDTKYLHLHLAAWSGESVKLSVTPSDYSSDISLTANTGISGSSSTYTFSGDPFTSDYYKVITFSNSLTSDTQLTFTATTGKRFVVFGVNAENGIPSIATDVEIRPTTIMAGSSGTFYETVTTPDAVNHSNMFTTSWSSDVEGFVNETTGAYNAQGLTSRFVKVNVTVNPTDNTSYQSFSKEFDIEVLEDGIFNFNTGLTYGSGLEPSNDYVEEAKTWTAGNVTLTTNGKYRLWETNNVPQLRIGYDLSTMQFAVPEGKAITQIVFNAGKFNLSTETGTLTEKTWTGKSRNVTFRVSATSEINSITVTYGDDNGKQSPELQISDIEAYVNTTPELTVSTKSTGAISFTSSNDEIAEVEKDGDTYVVMAYATGEVQITATQAETDVYDAAVVTFKVTVKPKKNPGLAISNLSIYMNEEKEFNVTTSSPATVTFTPQNDDIAMAGYDSESESYIAYGISVGTTTITASQAATDEYAAATTTFTVTVTEAPAVVKYQKITSTNNLTSGKYLIVNSDNHVAFDGSIEELNGQQGNTKNVNIDDGIIEVGIDNDNFYFNIENTGSANYSIKSASGYFIGKTESGNGMDISSSTAYSHTIEISSNGNAVITSLGSSRLQFYTAANSTPRFRYYRSDQKPIQLYKLVGKDAKFLPKFKGYTSIYYSDKNLVVPEKVTGLTYYVEDGRGHFNNDYPAGSIIPRNTAVVLEYEDKDNIPDAGVTVTFAETPATGSAPARNMLRGFDTAHTTTVDAGQNPDDYFFYRLTVGAVGSGKEGDVGFYWGEEDGAPFQAGAHKVYLAVEKSQFANAIQASSIIIDDSDNISEIAIPEKTIEGVYTLSGRRVYGNNLPKGIYIVNGKKMVIK